MEPFVISPSLRPDVRRQRQRLGGVREKHTGIRKSGAVIVQQSLSHARRKLEPRDHTSEQRLPWSVPVAIKLYEGLNVLLLVCSLEAVRKPFPLISNEPLEASTTVKQGSVKIEDHGLNIRSHRDLIDPRRDNVRARPDACVTRATQMVRRRRPPILSSISV